MAAGAVRRPVPSVGADGRGATTLGGASPAALLGRPVFDIDETAHGGYVSGSSVAVTGAAGSVGTELCARLVRLGARRLVLLDQAEAGLVDLVRMLEHDHGFTEVVPVLADITRASRARAVFEEHRPNVVFHAAAYKQVPLLEANPLEAVASNVLGTKHVVESACRVGVERFVLFSTDKAVAPSSVLGRTKAVAEWIVASAGNEVQDAHFGAVRLGNVADSAGSILPIFRRQLARGEPVTVTHPLVTRYLMTIGEAAGLAVVAGALADSRSIFWVDIRPAVRVVEMVRRLADAATQEATIEFVGLRVGERLHEHLFWEDDEVVATPCERVFRSPMRAVDRDWLAGWIDVLAELVDRASPGEVSAALAQMHGEAAAPTVAPEAPPGR